MDIMYVDVEVCSVVGRYPDADQRWLQLFSCAVLPDVSAMNITAEVEALQRFIRENVNYHRMLLWIETKTTK